MAKVAAVAHTAAVSYGRDGLLAHLTDGRRNSKLHGLWELAFCVLLLQQIRRRWHRPPRALGERLCRKRPGWFGSARASCSSKCWRSGAAAAVDNAMRALNNRVDLNGVALRHATRSDRRSSLGRLVSTTSPVPTRAGGYGVASDSESHTYLSTSARRGNPERRACGGSWQACLCVRRRLIDPSSSALKRE